MTKTIYNVVVAEDETLILNSLSKKINGNESGYKVVGLAEDGKEALDLVSKLNPHVLFTDIRMPILDGLQLIKKVRTSSPDIKIVIVSGYNNFEFARHAIDHDVDAYLLKPIKAEELNATLSKLRIILDNENKQLQESLSNVDGYNSLKPERIASLIQEYILKNYIEDININDIARHFGFNPSYLGRIYKEHIGESPLQSLVSLRLEKAKKLLKYSDESINIISRYIGYKNPYYFSRLFKKHLGLTPMEYRSLNSEL